MLIKVAVVTIPPITQAAVRVVIGAVLLAVIARAQGHRLPAFGPIWLLYLVLGLAGNVIPFALIGWGETRIDSALAAIFMATVPLFTISLAHFFAAGEPLTGAKVVGIVLGFSGVVILVGPGALSGLGAQVLGALLVIGAAFSYALTNVFAHQLQGRSPVVSGACVLACAGLWAVPASLLLEQPWSIVPDGAGLGALTALTLLSTAVGNLAYFRLIGSAGPSFTSLLNYLVPVVGVMFGATVLGERLGLNAALALVLVFAGIAATTGAPQRLWRRIFTSPPA